MDELIKLSKAQLTQIRNQGFTYVMFPDDSIIKVTMDDLLVKKDEIEELARELKEELRRAIKDI